MAQRLPEEIVQMARSQVVLGRVASTKDIGAQVVMFCRAESITGQVLVIDGGMPGGMH
jgi:3-oxoacyl-[acyl-carrier protein] reductase